MIETPLTPEMQEYTMLSPLLVAVQDKDEDEQWILFATFSSLPEEVRDLLTSPQTVDRIKQWSSGGLFPATHMVAVAKIIGFVVLDEVPMTSVVSLLEKLGLSTEESKKVEEKITELLEPFFVEKARQASFAPETTESAPPVMSVLPPLTRPTETGPKPIANKPLSPQPPSRNIIDLRQKQ